jgi:hypothetical protein
MDPAPGQFLDYPTAFLSNNSTGTCSSIAADIGNSEVLACPGCNNRRTAGHNKGRCADAQVVPENLLDPTTLLAAPAGARHHVVPSTHAGMRMHARSRLHN